MTEDVRNAIITRSQAGASQRQIARALQVSRGAVARVLAWLTQLGRPVCDAGTGAYCKARAKLTEVFLRFVACAVGRQLEEQASDAWRVSAHDLAH